MANIHKLSRNIHKLSWTLNEPSWTIQELSWTSNHTNHTRTYTHHLNIQYMNFQGWSPQYLGSRHNGPSPLAWTIHKRSQTLSEVSRSWQYLSRSDRITWWGCSCIIFAIAIYKYNMGVISLRTMGRRYLPFNKQTEQSYWSWELWSMAVAVAGWFGCTATEIWWSDAV